MASVATFTKLPVELRAAVFSYLTLEELHGAELVSNQHFRCAILSRNVYRMYFVRNTSDDSHIPHRRRRRPWTLDARYRAVLDGTASALRHNHSVFVTSVPKSLWSWKFFTARYEQQCSTRCVEIVNASISTPSNPTRMIRHVTEWRVPSFYRNNTTAPADGYDSEDNNINSGGNVTSRRFSWSVPSRDGNAALSRSIDWVVFANPSDCRVYLEPQGSFHADPNVAFFGVFTICDVDSREVLRKTACSALRSGIRWCLDFRTLLQKYTATTSTSTDEDTDMCIPDDLVLRIESIFFLRTPSSAAQSALHPSKQFTSHICAVEPGTLQPRPLKHRRSWWYTLNYKDNLPTNPRDFLATVPLSPAAEKVLVTTVVYHAVELFMLKFRTINGDAMNPSRFGVRNKYQLRMTPSFSEPMYLTLAVTRDDDNDNNNNNNNDSTGIGAIVLVAAIVAPDGTVVESHADVRSKNPNHGSASSDNPSHLSLYVHMNFESILYPGAMLYLHIVELKDTLDAVMFTLDLCGGKYKPSPEAPRPLEQIDFFDVQTTMFPEAFIPLHTLGGATALTESVICDLAASVSTSADITRCALCLHYLVAPVMLPWLAPLAEKNDDNSATDTISIPFRRAVFGGLWGMMDMDPLLLGNTEATRLANVITNEISRRRPEMLGSGVQPVCPIPVSSALELTSSLTPTNPRQLCHGSYWTYDSYLGTVVGVACNFIVHRRFQLHLRENPHIVADMLEMAQDDTWTQYHFALLNVLVNLRRRGMMLPRHVPRLVDAVRKFATCTSARSFRTRLSVRDMVDFFIPCLRSPYLECVEFGQWCASTMYTGGSWRDSRFTI
eukprot:PhM_4_TR5942/c0_g1_i1/m.1102